MRRAILATAGLATLSLSACAIPAGPVEVIRFNRVAEGAEYGKGSYMLVLNDADDDGKAPLESDADGLALSPYTEAVRREMNRLGYSDNPDGNPDYIVSLRVQLSDLVRSGRSPVSVGVGGGTGGYRSGVGVGLGLNLGGGAQQRIVTTLKVRIRNNADSQIIWEGSASQEAGAKSTAAQPAVAAGKLTTALFADFPGNNGETVTVK